jgi:hypothetical protein
LKNALYIFVVIWLLLFGSSRKAQASDQVDVELKSEYTIDLCGGANARNVLVTINMGTITSQDSLFGFNFEAFYDTSKIRFNTPVYINTLAELFDFKDMGFPAGKVAGYAANLNNRNVYGSRPLIAFLGRYVGNCPDTSTVRLSFIEFTDEFKKQPGRLLPAVVQAVLGDDPERKLGLSFDRDSIVFDNEGRAQVNLSVNLGKNTIAPDSLEIDFSLFDNSNFTIDSVLGLTDKLIITSQQASDSGIIIKADINDKNINGLNLIKLVVREREKKQATAFLKAVPEKPGQCECLKILNADSLKLISLADTTAVGESEVKNSIKGYYNSINDEFVFETAGDEIDNIEIYDLRGLMEEKLENLRHEGTLIINAVGFSDGFHLAVIKTYNKKEYKLILIKI